MYQHFNALKPAPLKKRLHELRSILAEQKLNGFLIPRADLYQNEYIEPCDSRLEWITGFTGSAGLCLVTLQSAFIFVDGRYKVQVKKEIHSGLFQIILTSDTSFLSWIQKYCRNQVIGYDPWLHTVSEIDKLASENTSGVKIKKCSNIVDIIWTQKPRRISQSLERHPTKFSGTTSKIKRAQIGEIISNNGADAVILTKPDSICWLLNIRGKDIAHTPIVQSLAIVQKNSNTKLFLRDVNISRQIKRFLGDFVEVLDQTMFLEQISSMKNQTVQIDPNSCPVAVLDSLTLPNDNILKLTDPCIRPKAIKNPIEIKGAKEAHILDATAFIRFLHWLDTQIDPSELDEISIIKKLEAFRRQSNLLEEIAFDTICGSGSNGAIVHYKVNTKTNKKIEKNNLLLIDSGGQYRMGTTDLTRTIVIGRPKQKMIDAFTYVLKGMIKISNLNWPIGLSGQHIDALARAPLWSIGLDYDHGTGHGIGSYLSVHEGPHGISRRNNFPLEPGMLVSNEPGYYEVGQFGIRIENVLLIKKLPKTEQCKNIMLAFETLTLVPIDKKLINVNLLSKIERKWINSYHSDVYKTIAPSLYSDARKWLKTSCSKI